MAADNNQTLTQPFASALAWTSRAGVLLDPQSVFGPNVGKYDSTPTTIQDDRSTDTLSDIGSGPSVDSFVPLPEYPNVSSQSELPYQNPAIPMEQRVQYDTSFDEMEQFQAKEQSRLLDRFKLLKQWQQQQKEKLAKQQQEQLEFLRSEQHRVHQTLIAQRQKQWGAGRVVQSPPRSPTRQSDASPQCHGARGMSSVPQAIANGTVALGQTAGPYSLLGPHYVQDEDLDDTTSEPNSSIVEEGIYPLPETASEISDDAGGRYQPDEVDRVIEGDQEEEQSLEEHMDEFTPEKVEPSHLTRNETPIPSEQHNAMRDDNDESMLGDDRPIRTALGGGSKTFEDLIEEQMKREQEKNQHKEIPSAAQSSSPGQKTFLRRGQGMSRFGQFSLKPPKTKKKTNIVKEQEDRSKSIQSRAGSVGNSAKEEGIPGTRPSGKIRNKQSPPALSRKVAVIKQSLPSHLSIRTTKSKTSKSAIDREKLPPPQPNNVQGDIAVPVEGVNPDYTIEMSFHMRMQELEKKAEVEKEELDEFELLEQAADDNASFSSNASLVVTMMKRTVARRQNSLGALSEKSLQASQEEPIKTNGQSYGWSDPESDNSDIDRTLKDGNVDVHLMVSEERTTAEKVGSSTEDDSDLSSSSTSNQINTRTKQSWEFVSNGSEFSANLNYNNSGSGKTTLNDPGVVVLRQQTDSSEEGDGSSDEEMDNRKHQAEGMDQSDVVEESDAEKCVAETSSHAVNVDFEDEESWGDLGNALSGDSDDDSIIAGLPVHASTPPVSSMQGSVPLDRRKLDSKEDDLSSPPTSKLVSKLFPKLKPAIPKQQLQEKQQETILEKASERPIGDGVQSKLLRDKLCELENEIERFRKENTMLAKLREEREKNLASLQREIDEFQKQKTEELKRIEDFREEEMKKLRREKKNFDKYQKAMRAMPDKKDRSEIEMLTKQLSDLQEELNKRESRWQANSSRLRTRVDMLENENKDLGDEVEKLQGEREEIRKKEERKAKSNAAKRRAHQLAELESARLASFPVLPRVNVSSGSSDEEDSSKNDRKESLTQKPDNDDDVQIINKVQSAQKGRNNHDRKSNSGAPKKSDADSVARMKSPPKPARVATLEPHHNRISASQDSQPRMPRKRSVHFDVSPTSGDVSSPEHQASPGSGSPSMPGSGSLSMPGSGNPSMPGSGSPSMPTWNLDHPAVSHDDSSVFGDGGTKINEEEEEIHHPNGKVERIGPDGTRVITFSNGTRKEISADGQSITVTFFNGDMKQIMADKRVVYYYSENGTTHTTYPDGLEILQFPNNQTEKHYPDGTKEITFPDHTIKYLFANGNEESVFADGTVLRVDKHGDKTMEFPNGQREIHTKQYKKREYPDGSVKTVYTDGRQETRYSNGRIRVKDKDGSVILDKTC